MKRIDTKPIIRPRVGHLMLTLTLTLMFAVVLTLGGACSGKLPWPVAAGSCGDRCAALNCPAGSRCTFSASCAPYCEPEFQR
jgi:hypothetical protein